MRTHPAGPLVLALMLSMGMTPRSIAAAPATTQAATAALLTPAEATAVDAVIASAVAAGFPDGKGATVYAGKVTVSATFDPAKDPPPLPSAASNVQMTDPNSAKVTYGYEFDGLHFKLADGSWVLSCTLRG